MNVLWDDYIKPLLQKWLFAPFSNKVTKILLVSGAALVAAPLIEHLVIKVLLLHFFNINLPIDVPDVPAYISGIILMVVGALHNLCFQYLGRAEKEYVIAERKKKRTEQHLHDQKIIIEILSLLPYEDTQHWISQSSRSGLKCEFVHDLDECEKYAKTPYALYNTAVEEKKQELISAIREFNLKCLDYLGSDGRQNGKMYLPPYHLKGYGGDGKKYYRMLHEVDRSGQDFLKKYDNFIECVKKEGFVIEKI